MAFSTPLRYPGGKGSLGPWLADLITANSLKGGVYVEPYAGGAGAGIYLLSNNHVSKIIINDVDPAIYSFWWAVLNDTNRFITKLMRCKVTLIARHKHRKILNSPSSYSRLEVGFAAFFLNRTNRSGILRGGVIGGKDQLGNYKIDARFNKIELVERISRIGALRDSIELHGIDAMKLIGTLKPKLPKQSLIYFDPPYFEKGPQLYRNFYTPEDHEAIANCLKRLSTPWLVTYDDCAPIRALYKGTNEARFSTYYSTHESRRAKSELMYYGNLNALAQPYMKRASPGNLEARPLR